MGSSLNLKNPNNLQLEIRHLDSYNLWSYLPSPSFFEKHIYDKGNKGKVLKLI